MEAMNLISSVERPRSRNDISGGKEFFGCGD